MSGVAAAIAGTGLISAYVGSQASKTAASAQADAANNANATTMAMFNTEQANQKPYREAGVDALHQIQTNMPNWNKPFTMSDFQADPGFQFEMDQGRQAIEASAAAHSGLISGNELTNVAKFSQNLARTGFGEAFNRYNTNNQNAFSRLSSVAGLGQTSVQNSNQSAQNTGAQIGQNLAAGANASAAGTVGTANAISSGIGTGVNGYLNYNILSKLGTGTVTPNNAPLNGSESLTLPTPHY